MFDWFNKGHCTWFPDVIFEVDIGDLCYDHDAAYGAKVYSRKLISDAGLFEGIWDRAERSKHPVAMKATAVGVYAAVATVGNLFWLKARVKENEA